MRGYYKTLIQGDKNHAPLSPKSVQNIHGILHKAMEQAVNAQLIHINPCDHVRIPKVEKAALKPLMDEDVIRFLTAIKGDRYEQLFFVALFSGLRQSELLGLEWGDVDFGSGEITVQRQLQRDYSSKKYIIVKETKNEKSRVVSVVETLKAQRIAQTELQLAVGECWSNPQDFVFTDEKGGHLKHHTVYHHFKSIVRSINCESTRFHNLRHSYAINALQTGDSPKVVQEQLGHYSSAFTMDTYAEVSKTMRSRRSIWRNILRAQQIHDQLRS